MQVKKVAQTALKILLPVAIFLVVIFNYDTLKHLDVRALIEGKAQWIAAAIVLGVYALKAMVFVIPASLIYLSVGMSFSTPVAVTLNCIGIAIEVTISYLLGRFLGGEKVDKMLRGKKGYALFEKLRNRGRYAFVFLLRFSSFPIDFGSLFFGASDFAFPSYFLMSLCGVLPRVIALTILGDEIYRLNLMQYIPIAILCAVPVVLIVFAVTAVRKKKRAQTGGEVRSDPE